MQKNTLMIALVALSGVLSASTWAEPQSTEKADSRKPAADVQEGKPSKASSRQAELEQRFKELLTGCVLKGTWQMVHGEEGKPLTGKPLSEPRPEEYTISRVSKAGEDYWVIVARIKYADKDVHIPVTVRVVWAEDTPIITLNNMSLPGLGTYSARVMVYRDFYAGTWFGDCYGGILSGQIVKPEEEETNTDRTDDKRVPTTQPADQ